MSIEHVLLVEDDDAIALVIETAMAREGLKVDRAATLAERNAELGANRYSLMITDVILPDGNGLTELSGLQDHFAIGSVIVLSAQNTLNTAIRASEEGAFDYLPKPFDLNELTRVAKAALSRRKLAKQSPSLGIEPDTSPLVGRAASMQDVYRTIAKLATNDLSVLILGESGTGKELVAQAIHDTGLRKNGPFVAVNMAAIPRELIESELFGHEKGAFTGAHARAIGRFEQAAGGTLFLDEIGDMPLEAQTRLLRVLQSEEFVPVGAARPIHADIRIIAATNQNLPLLIADNRFREDLYYRLNVIPVSLPPLRERREDIPALIHHFVALSAGQGLSRKNFTSAAMARMESYDWPGNIRELKNIVQRLLILARDDDIDAGEVARLLLLEDKTISRDDCPALLAQAVDHWVKANLSNGSNSGHLYEMITEEIEKSLLPPLLELHKGNQLRVADHLGINRNTLRKKLLHHGLAADRTVS